MGSLSKHIRRKGTPVYTDISRAQAVTLPSLQTLTGTFGQRRAWAVPPITLHKALLTDSRDAPLTGRRDGSVG